MASAAASETAPRMPLQPSTSRSAGGVGSRETIRRCETAGTTVIHSSRTPITTSAIERASKARSTSRAPSIPSTRLVSCRPTSRNSSPWSRNSDACQNARVRSRAPACEISSERVPMYTPAVTTARTPDTWIPSAGT